MSFDHTTVTSIEDGTKVYAGKFAAAFKARLAGDDTVEQRLPKMYWVDGIPVCERLSMLCAEIRNVYRDIKFGTAHGPDTVWENGVLVASEVWAYFDGDTYAPLRVGYKTYTTKGSGGSQFGVYARCIRNSKYNEGRDQYYMALSDKLDRALGNVKKNLRRYRVEEVARLSVDRIANAIGSLSYDATNKALSSKRELIEHSGMVREFRHLVHMGHEFVDADFKGCVIRMLEEHREYETRSAMQHHAYYVGVRYQHGEQVFDVLAVHDIMRSRTKNLGANYNVHTAETLPEGVAEKVAALSMLEDGKFIDDLGLKVSDLSYWVLM